MRKDPTLSLERKTSKTVSELKEQNNMDKKKPSHLTPKHSVRIHGLPKIHKEKYAADSEAYFEPDSILHATI